MAFLTSSPTSSLSWTRLGMGSGALVSTLLLLSPATSAAATLSAWQFDPATQQLTLTLPSGVVPQYAIEAGTNQLVIELPQTQLGDVATEQTYEGAIQRISLSQVTPGTVQVVLDVSPEVALAEEPVQLVSMAAGEQTRWVITPLTTPAAAVADLPATPPISGNGNGMIVELPTMPAADPYLAFPAAGTGRLSTSAANLMLPSDIDNLANLPETLPIDPFNIGFAGSEQVSVPSLEDLDATVGTAPTTPPASAPLSPPDTAATPPASTPSDSVALTTPPPPRGAEASAATEPTTPESAEPPAARSSEPTVTAPALPDLPPVSVTPAPESPSPGGDTPDAPIDSETTGVPIPVQPSVAESAPTEPMAETPPTEPAPTEPVAEAAPAEPTPTEPVAEAPPAEPAPAEVAEAPPVPAESAPAAAPATPPTSTPESAPVMAQEPPAQPPAQAVAPAPAEAAPTRAIAVDPPPGHSPPPAADQAPLAVPTAPSPAAPGTAATPGLPAELPPPFAIAAGEAIPFGAPLPGDDVTYGAPAHRAVPQPGTPPSDRPVSPDTLIAAGTVLALRYPGNEARPLGDFKANEVMLLQNDIRDPITHGVLAPAGSQLIGHFEPGQNGQRWVSHTLITPNGQRVPLASNTEYFIGPPDIAPGMLALGTGAGALAMTLLTGGFGAFALLGGALVGATTAVGTSPHLITLEPNQIIHVQVIQDVPRAMPVAAAPERSREWGTPGDW